MASEGADADGLWALRGVDEQHQPNSHPQPNNKPQATQQKKFTCPRRPQKFIAQLERQQVQLAQRVATLEAEHSRLEQEHLLLVSCCDGLQTIRLGRSEGSVEATLQGLVGQEELQLLQQLQSTPYSHLGSAANSVSPSFISNSVGRDAAGNFSSSQAADELWISSQDDVMQYFHLHLAAPPFPGAQELTTQELAADYANTVQQLALQLHLLKVPGGYTSSSPLQRIEYLIDRHLSLITTLALQNRGDTIEAFLLTNFETFETDQGPSEQKHAWITEQLKFSERQKATIVRGMKLFKRLLGPIISERQQLQQQIAAEQDQREASPSSAASYSSGGSDSLAEAVARLSDLEKQAARLAQVLRKEYIIRFAVGAWIVGCMTYLQLAELAVLGTPHPVKIVLIGKVLLDQQQQQELP